MKRILRPGENCMGIYGVRESGLLVDGHDYYRAFYEAARSARSYILLAGWQFDSEVSLIRGDDTEDSKRTRLLPFLNSLCEENPELNIYILAWDFAEIYLIDREWFQEWVFNWTTNERVRFRFDDRHAVGASHHEKSAVIDGRVAFVGGMDICASRWDDRRHLADNPDRKNANNKAYEPYHDIQSLHVGRVAQELAELFKIRWENSGGEMLELPPYNGDYPNDIKVTMPVHAGEVGVSRTRAKTIVPHQESIREIRTLYINAIEAAEKLIYIENQYFSSEAVYRAMVNRLKAKDRSKLQIVVVLPKRQHAITEAISMGLTQVKMLKSLRDVASEGGHSIGIYYSLAEPHDMEMPIYIHSKVMVVDDRLMTVGSANINNRSMGFDTELNISWEAHTGEHDELARSIRAVRVGLLREHAGSTEEKGIDLETAEGIVQRLDGLADSQKSRLRRHTMETIVDERILPRGFDPEELMLDPEKPIVEENVFELISHDKTGIFAEGITFLSDVLANREAGHPKRMLRLMWTYRWVIFMTATLFLLALLLFLLWPEH